MIKKKIYIAVPIACILALLLIIFGRVFTLKSTEAYSQTNVKNYSIDNKTVLEHLSKSIQYKTISYQDNSKVDKLEFTKFHKFLEDSFPNIHKNLQREKVNELSLLYKWQGTENNSDAILLMAHMDVVPANELSEKSWKYPPFSGKIIDGYVWGRGALDMKSQLMGEFEAIDALIRKGYKPKKTIYIAFGHDEEVSGINGNYKIASYLESKGVKLSAVLDEGGFVVKNMISGINDPVALVGVAEKGYLTLELSATDNGGHSALPPKHSAIGKLASAINALEANQFEAKISEVTQEFLKAIAPEMPFAQKLAFANMWLFKPLILNTLNKSDNSNALIRTTIVSTMIDGGVKENTLPQHAKALVNFRILQGESVDSVIAKVKKVINNDQISIKAINSSWNPSIVSASDSEEFKDISVAAKATFSNVVVAPYLVAGSTDSRYYQNLTNKIYRFSPVEVSQDDLKTIHGVNEKINNESYIKLINFYCRFIEELQK
ncbi:M20 family peptidase [Clostridium sp. DJ247]|uniref:M20 family peptidase n=1 Tax=Clostridium sp. DJ247 TaxID=2726188 RepID=UPI0016279502|nr:M20 family peptidase [Clostridium sp. DJ247]MBC2581091.1 M20/M25/M40 family metallo-hydrolase [Clostridium sp. DJ247]